MARKLVLLVLWAYVGVFVLFMLAVSGAHAPSDEPTSVITAAIAAAVAGWSGITWLLIRRWWRSFTVRFVLQTPDDDLEDLEAGWAFVPEEPLEIARAIVTHVLTLHDAWLFAEGDRTMYLEAQRVELPFHSDPPPGLMRHTTWSMPREKALAVPIRPDTVDDIRDQLLPGLSDRATHLQFSAAGRLMLGLYDWMEHGSVPKDGLGQQILDDLVATGAITRLSRVTS